MKHFSLFILAILFSVASFAQVFSIEPSTGGMCVGSGMWVTDSSSSGGGVWSSSNTLVATVSTGGYISGVAPGTVTISYTIGSTSATGIYTVGAVPASITGGPTTFCTGTTATFSDATPGGNWSSGDTYVATVSATGVVTGMNPGGVAIYYTVSGCSVQIYDTVTGSTVSSIDSSTTSICVGSSTTLTDATVGGVWSSSNLAVGTVNPATGVFTGIAAGTTSISYTISGGCGSTSAELLMTVSNTTGPVGTISGATHLYLGGGTITLYDVSGTGGGTWSSSNPAIATVNPSDGTVTAVSIGTTSITYSITGCGGPAYTSQIDTVENFGGISGNVLFSTPYYGNVKVWLITYNTTTMDLEAVDSQYASGSGGSYYYQFDNPASDSFRVKAGVTDDSAGVITSGPIPTYHDSSFYWYSANVIAHAIGIADINENIYMLYGTTTGGPGFISGNVTTGANRSTSSTIPAVGLHMVVLNTSTGSIAGMAFTNSSGNYTFSNLPYGTYMVFPDSVNYMTTPYSNIILSASTPSFSTATFVQHTISKTITPETTTGVSQVIPSVSSVSAFPNPTSGKLTIQWTEKTTEKSTLMITDITGREVYKSVINMNQGAGMTSIDLSALTNGLYMISVKSASLNYNNKLEIAH